MKQIIRKTNLVLIVLILGLMGCKNDASDTEYNAKEFALLLATSNHGEVGPCG